MIKPSKTPGIVTTADFLTALTVQVKASLTGPLVGMSREAIAMGTFINDTDETIPSNGNGKDPFYDKDRKGKPAFYTIYQTVGIKGEVKYSTTGWTVPKVNGLKDEFHDEGDGYY